MVFQKEGNRSIDISEALSKSGKPNSNGSFPDSMIEMNLRNSVFVDCTSDHYIAARYADILEAGIAVVTCNKIANSLDMDYYKRLRSASRRENTPFLYETNVGAALPVISLIRQMRRSGDTPNKIEACLSGTLNYVFGKYDGTVPFHKIIEEASRLGYTEPDPMTDLSGTDVLRKALILARECGLEAEEGEIETHSFIPSEWPNEDHFKNILQLSIDRGSKLRYVARIENGIIKTGLEQVPASHPFSCLRGTDSSIILYSRLYTNGLRIEGAGAGAAQTASGLLNDILQTQ
jgi:aspartokinase/homoserine dehydrogenase 1